MAMTDADRADVLEKLTDVVKQPKWAGEPEAEALVDVGLGLGRVAALRVLADKRAGSYVDILGVERKPAHKMPIDFQRILWVRP